MCVSSTLKDFGLNPKNMGAEIGMTMVLHTHSRRLDFHPNVHVVVPGGGIDKQRRQWKKKKGKYLFNEFSLATVFRARFLEALKAAGLSAPKNVPAQWVVDCDHVGKSITALKYLSRYLYRGVLSERNIVSNKEGRVSFKSMEAGVIFFRHNPAVHLKTGGLNFYGINDFLKACLQINGFVRPKKMTLAENTRYFPFCFV